MLEKPELACAPNHGLQPQRLQGRHRRPAGHAGDGPRCEVVPRRALRVQRGTTVPVKGSCNSRATAGACSRSALEHDICNHNRMCSSALPAQASSRVRSTLAGTASSRMRMRAPMSHAPGQLARSQ